MPRSAAMLALLGVLFATLLSQSTLAQSPDILPGSEPLSQLPKQAAYTYEFNDAELQTVEEWLKWARLELPIKLDGRVSGWLWIQRSQKSWLDLSGYRAEAELRSPELTVDTWKFSGAILRLGYSRGRWRVGRLAGRIGTEGSKELIGKVNIVADLPANAPRTVEVSVAADDLQVQPILASQGATTEIDNSPASLELRGKIPLAGIRDVGTWQAVGRLIVSQFNYRSTSGSLETDFRLTQGNWTTLNETIKIAETPLQLSAKGSLSNGVAFSATLSESRIDVRSLLIALGNSTNNDLIQGEIVVQGTLSGSAGTGLEKAELTATSEQITYQDSKLENVALSAKLAKNASDNLPLQLGLTSSTQAGGAINGNLRWGDARQIAAEFPTSARISLDDASLAWFGGIGVARGLSGLVSGEVELNTLPNRDTTDWKCDTDLDCTGLAYAGIAVGDLRLSATKAIDEPTLRAQLTSPTNDFATECTVSVPATANNQLIMGVEEYTISGTLDAFTLLIPPRFVGDAADSAPSPVTTTGAFTLRGDTTNWLASGQATLDSVRLRLGGKPVELQGLVAKLSPEALRLERFHIRDRVGKILGSAQVKRDNIGKHLLNLRVANLEVSPYVAAFAPESVPSIDGQIAVDLRLEKDAGTGEWTQGWTGHLDGSVSKLAIRTVPIGELTITGHIEDSQANIAAGGTLLGGPAKLKASISTTTNNSDSTPIGAVKITSFETDITGLELDRLMACILGIRAGIHYDGLATISVSAQPADHGLANWSLNLTIPKFSYDNRSLAQSFGASLRYKGGILHIDQLSGGIAGGRVKIVGDLSSNGGSTPRGTLRFSANQLDIAALVAFAAPKLADRFTGQVSYRGSANITTQAALYGDCQLRDATAYGLPIQDLRTRLRVQASSQKGFLNAAGTDVHGTVLGGQASGSFQVRGGPRWQLASALKISNGRIDQLSAALGFEHIVGTGRFDASGQIRSRDITALTSLAGPLSFKFDSGNAQSMPVLSDLGKLVPLAQIASSNIKNGFLTAQLGQGIVRIKTVFVESDAFWLTGSGDASLTSQRLDMNAMLQTGGGFDKQLAQIVVEKLLVLTVPPLAVVTEINELLRNRTIFLHVGGTSKHPAIQLKAGQTVGRAVLQTLRRQIIAIPSTPLRNNSSSNMMTP